jgi:L-ascorbate metabolism protein UlaG (beta-lactamase superfamily)
LFGAPDFCLMPIGAYNPPLIMKKSHVNPQEAVAAFHELGGKNFIPMHYGCFDLSDEPPGEPLRIIQEMAFANQIKGKLITPAIGEEITI